MAEVKALLKEARKLIDENNLKEAQECCKNILKKDKQNYLALILLGKSLQGTDQAPLAFQKAITLKPDNPLAWQGLASYYEKKDDVENKSKLLTVYDEMLKVPMDFEKTIEILIKLGQLGICLKNNTVISMLIGLLKNEKLDKKIKDAAEQQFVNLLNNGLICIPSDNNAALEILQEIYKNNPDENLEQIIAKIIMQNGDFVTCVEKVMGLEFFSNNKKVREYLCKKMCQEFMKNNSFKVDIGTLFEIITKGIETCKEANLLKSMMFYANSSYSEAYKLCIPLINYHDPELYEASFIIRCTLMLKKWDIAQKLALNFLNKAKDINFITTLKQYLFQSLIRQKKWSEAKAAIKDVPLESFQDSDIALLVECGLELGDNVQDLVLKLKESKYYLPLQALCLLKQNQYEETVTLLEGRSEGDPISLFYLGKAYWELQNPEKSQYNILKAAKLDSENPLCFLYLGHYYEKNNDLDKAKKCYERAYNLNKVDNECAKNLSNIYSRLKLLDQNLELLLKAEQDINDKWINFRLGLHYLNVRLWEKAIIQFRNVIKKDHNNVTAFECLADAYYGRGSYTSALRAYSKVIAMDGKRSNHCQTRMGYIFSLLTQYEEAIQSFKTVLLENPNSALASKGLSETWMRIARKKREAKLYGCARDAAQEAVNHLTHALTKHKQHQSLWKLLGDTLIFITQLPEKNAYVFTDFWPGNDNPKKSLMQIFPLALACFSYITKVKQESSSYDLALSYLAYYYASKDINHCKIAFNLTLECLKKKPSTWKYWNLLGKIAMFLKKYDIAQHCFVKALNTTRKWSVAKIWCNLGTLYLKLKLYKIANYCFWRGQSTLPSYTQSWIGQALIAEATREEEAMDLFRHAARLGYHRESALGYADWVCRTLKNGKNIPDYKYVIQGLNAIPFAIDLVEWFNCFVSEDPCAYTIFGILQERFGLLTSALQSYEKAFKFVSKERSNIVLLNIARLKLRMGKYDEAVTMYKSITEASFDSACGLALALFKNGLYEESYSAYDTALHWLSNDDEEKAELLVAMAGIVYKFKGADDAKTLLFHSIQVSQKKPTPHSLFAICSLGLLHTDQSLSKLALGELKKYEKDGEYAYDIGFLKSYIHVCEKSTDKALKVLSETLHDHPDNALLWFCLAQYYLELEDEKPTIASMCAQRALSCTEASQLSIPAVIIATSSIAEHLAGNSQKSLATAKRGLHMYPHQSEIWAALIFSIYSTKSQPNLKSWTLQALKHVRKNLEMTKPLVHWTSLIEKKIQILQ